MPVRPLHALRRSPFRAVRSTLLAVVSLLAAALPGRAAVAPCTGPLELSAQSSGRTAAVRWRGGGCGGSLEVSGEVRWGDDALPSWLAGGAFVRGEEEVDGSRRRLAVHAGDGGAPVFEWWVDGAERPFDAAARAWLAEHGLLLLRQTGFQADQRVAGLLADGGVDGLLTEVEAVDNDRVEALYLAAALQHGGLAPDEEARLLRAGGRLVTADADLASLLVAAARPGAPDATLLALAQAAPAVGSDADRSRALAAGLRAAASAPARTALLDAAAGVGSDGDLADLLAGSVGRLDLIDAGERRAFAAAVHAISSDGDKARTLASLAQRSDLPAEALGMLLETASGIASDGDLASLLVTVAQRHELTGELRRAYRRTAGGIASQGDRQRALDAL